MERVFDARKAQRTVFDALLDAAREYGARRPILEDQERTPLSYTDLIRASFALGRKIAGKTTRGERVGLLLPSSSAAVVTFFGLHAFGRMPAMLNFTAGLRNLRAAVKLAGVERVLTSHRFIEQGKLHDLIDALEDRCEIIYLEDVRRTIGGRRSGVGAWRLAVRPPGQGQGEPEPMPAVILFTSGSFGAPRGVVLSQANLLANVAQVAAHIELDPDWVMFNPLPDLPLFRPDRRGAAADPHRHEGLPISEPFAREADPGSDPGQQSQHSPGHRHLREPVRPRGRDRRSIGTEVRRLRRRAGAGGDPPSDRGAIRIGAFAGRLWSDGSLASDRGEQTQRQSPRHGRRLAARASRPASSRSRGSPEAGACSCAAPTS